MSNGNQKGLYFGWVIVVTSFLGMAFVFAPAINLAGLLVSPMADDFGATRTAAALAITMFIFASMFGNILAGTLFAKLPMKMVITVAAAITAVCYFLSSMANSLTVIYGLSIVRGVCGSMLTVIPISIMINNWFGPKVRGKAMAIAMMGSGVGAIIMNPIMAPVIANYGWRTAYVIFAVMALVLIPLALFTYVPSPAMKGITRIGDDPNEAASKAGAPVVGLTSGQAFKTAMFYIAAVSVLLMSAASQSYLNNAPGFLTDLAFNASFVAILMTVTNAANAIGKIIVGAICDKAGAKVGTMVSAGSMLVAYVLLVVCAGSPSVVVAAVAAVIVGFGMSGTTLVLPLITGDLFGNKAYGQIVGYMNVFSSLGSSMVPLVVTIIFDSTGSYTPAWIAVAAVLAVIILMINVAYGMKKGVYSKLEDAPKAV